MGKKIKHYNPTEAAKILGVSKRAVQKRCLKADIRKKDNCYYIPLAILDKWRVEIKTNEPSNEPQAVGTRKVRRIEKENQLLQDEISRLKDELKQFDLEPDERIEVFTQTQYAEFEKRLTQYSEMQKEIEFKEKLFDAESESKDTLIKHYRSQFQFQQKQNEQILMMHEKLIDSIDLQLKNANQRNIIEATEKKIIGK